MMIEFLYQASEIIRPVLFFLLLAYLPMKLGVGLDVAAQAPTVEQVVAERMRQLQFLRNPSLRIAALYPLRVLTFLYFTLWLATDKYLYPLMAIFLMSILPFYL